MLLGGLKHFRRETRQKPLRNMFLLRRGNKAEALKTVPAATKAKILGEAAQVKQGALSGVDLGRVVLQGTRDEAWSIVHGVAGYPGLAKL